MSCNVGASSFETHSRAETIDIAAESDAGTLGPPGLEDLEGHFGDTGGPVVSRPYPHGGARVRRALCGAICAGALVFVLLLVDVALSAESLRWSKAALEVAQASAAASQRPQVAQATAPDTAGEAGPRTGDAPPALVPAAAGASLPPTREPTAAPTTPRPTGAPTDPHPMNPQWFHTNHEQYQAIIDMENADLDHPWLIASLFCHRRSLHPCGYDAYCPNGKGRPSYGGGPPTVFGRDAGGEGERSGQWAPLAFPTEAQGLGWVQVGAAPAGEGGSAANGFGACWSWEEWTRGARGGIEDALGEEHRQWILCCEKESHRG